PHAEAEALTSAGARAAGAHLFVTLEPCAHESARGPACADLIVASGVARVSAALTDPDPRTAGRGTARLREAGIEVDTGVGAVAARQEHAGFLTRQALGRPRITLKLAMSIDGRVALASGESQWITGPAARDHAHMMRAESDMILIGRGTFERDDPSLDVRLPGLADRSPRPVLLSRTLTHIPPSARLAARDAVLIADLTELATLNANDILVEGGAGLAGSLIAEDIVDRLLIYRAPILIGDGAPGLGGIGLAQLADAHGRWRVAETHILGPDRLEIYTRMRTAGGAA
ncbi:MAG: bifunctional diaminohydroxyphosphoribosylaminopyrimidine deaminase/5-amino-6-(5-phosphoribosylamino)uracil reductase RibD, partial [Pseudomonadota bacterium]